MSGSNIIGGPRGAGTGAGEWQRELPVQDMAMQSLRRLLGELPIGGLLAKALGTSLESPAKFNPASVAQSIGGALIGETPHTSAGQVKDVLAGLAQGVVAWGQDSKAFNQPESVRIQMAEARNDLETSLASISSQTPRGEGFAPFLNSAQRMSEQITGLDKSLARSDLRPGLDLFAAVAQAVTSAGRSLLEPVGSTGAQALHETATTRSVMAGKLRLDSAVKTLPLIDPPPGGYPSIEKSGQKLKQTLATLSGAVRPEVSQKLNKQVDLLLKNVQQAKPLPLQPGQADTRSITPQAALHMLNSILGEIAIHLREAGPLSRKPGADQAMLGADPAKVALDPKAMAKLAAILQNFGGGERQAAGATQALPAGLLQVMARVVQMLEGNRTTDLQTLGPQVSNALNSARHGDVSAGATTSGLTPGNIPVEARQVPSGISSEEAADKSKALNETITNSDVGRMRDLAKDDKAMALATPEEKAAMARTLADRAVASGEDRDGNREAINNLLKSTGSPEQYQRLMEEVGPDQIQVAMQAGVAEPAKDKYLVDFNVLAGAMGASAYATDPEQAAMGEDARAKGYSTQEILAARNHAANRGDDDDIKSLSEDPLAMMLSTSHEKANMINQLKDGWTTDSEDRAIVSILESSKGKAEFDTILSESGEKGVGDELDDDEAKRKYDLICGAYGRYDDALNADVAHWADGAMTDPAKTQHLLGGADQEVVQPKAVDANKAVPAADRRDPLMARSDIVIANQEASISAQVDTLDQRATVDTVLTNAEREHDGKDLVNPRDLREQTNTIMNDSSLTDDQKKDKVDELRKGVDLSEYTMRNVATQPLTNIYSDAAQETGGFYQANRSALEESLKRAEERYGKDSPQAQAAQAELDKLDQKLGTYAKHLEGVGKTLGDMYPPPTSFWEDFVGVFGKIADMLAPLLQAIPGWGSLLYAGYVGVKAGMAIADGDVGGVFSELAGGFAGYTGGMADMIGFNPMLASECGVYYKMQERSLERAVTTGDVSSIVALASNALGPIGGAVGGTVGTALTIGSQILSAGNQVYRGTEAALRGDVLGAVSGYGGAVLGGAGLAGLDTGTLDSIKTGVGLITNGAKIGVGLADGKWDTALGGLAGMAGNVSDLGLLPDLGTDTVGGRVLNLIEQGARFGSNLAGGNYLGALDQLGGAFNDPGIKDWLSSAMENPTVRDIVDMTTAGAGVVGNFMKGNYADALQGLTDGIGGLDIPDLQNFLDKPVVQDVLNYSQQGATFFQNLRDGKYAEALGVLGQNLGPVFGSEDLQQTLGSLGHMGKAVQAGINRDFLGLQQQLGQAFEGSDPLLKLLGDGDFTRGLGGLADSARQVLDNPAFQQASQLLGQGSAFTQALLRGNYAQALSQVSRLPGLETLGPSFDRARATLANVTPFITDMASGQYLRGLAALAGGNNPLAGHPALQQALSQARDATSFFASMTSGLTGMGPRGLGSALTGLQQLSGLLTPVGQLEQMARKLIAQTGGNVDQAARLLWQSAQGGSLRPTLPYIHG